jgi:hypothetical protein
MDKKILEKLPFYLWQAYEHTDPEQYADVQRKVKAELESPEYLIGFLQATLRIIRRGLEHYIEDLQNE